MGLEASVTKISDLNQSWPLSTDKRKEGDDHLRYIKVAVRSLLTITGLGDICFPASVAGKAGQGLKLNAGETAYELAPVGFADRGDPVAYDKLKADLSFDAAWHNWDLSAIVPSGAKSVLLGVVVQIAAGAGSTCISFRKDGNANAVNVASCGGTGDPVSVEERRDDVVVALSAARVIEYYCHAAAANYDYVGIVVRGWFF
jgi:hypothetical protein